MRTRRERALQRDGTTFGQDGWTALVLLVLMIGFVVVCAVLRTRNEAPEAVARQVESWIVAAVLSAIVTGTMIARTRGPGIYRERSLRRRFPDAVVVASGRAFDLVAGLSDWRERGIPGGRVPKLPVTFTLVGSAEGLRIWVALSGTNSSWLLPWASISHVVSGSVSARVGRLPAIVAVVGAEGTEQIALPFVITGSGFAGLFSQSRPAVEDLAARLESMRREAMRA